MTKTGLHFVVCGEINFVLVNVLSSSALFSSSAQIRIWSG